MVLDQGAEPGVVLQLVALLLPPPLEAQVRPLLLPQVPEGGPLVPPGGVAVQQRQVVEPPGLGRPGLHRGVAGRARQVLDVQGQGVDPPAARREVGARLDPVGRQGGMQGVDGDHAGAPARGPGAERPQVGEVADAPAPGRPARRELHRQHPLPQAAREVAAAGVAISRVTGPPSSGARSW